MSRSLSLKLFCVLRTSFSGSRILHTRAFTTTHSSSYDGVYKDLQIIKLQKPWLKALAEQKAGTAPTPAELEEQELTPKRMSDSYRKLILPLGHDEWLVDGYVNATGQLRLGFLFQDLDALAGEITYKHTGPAPTIVTAAVDRISIMNPLESFCDLELSGHVSYVGISSMEISLEVRRVPDGQTKRMMGDEGLLLTCAFTMVALDPVTKKQIPVNPLIADTPEEKVIFQRGEENKRSKKVLAKRSLEKQIPN